MILLRRVIGDALRARRQSQQRTLREVATVANVSLGYLSEIERGQKEASSELLAAICEALGAQLSELLREVSDTLALAEEMPAVLVPARAGDGRETPAVSRGRSAAGREPVPAGAGREARGGSGDGAAATSADSASDGRSRAPVAREDDRAVAGRGEPATLSSGRDDERVAPHRHGDAPTVRATRPVAPVESLVTDGRISVAVRRDGPLKTTLLATRTAGVARAA